MAANSAHSRLSRYAASFHAWCALTLALIGVLGVLDDSSGAQTSSWSAYRTLFGTVLLLSVIARFSWQLGHAGLRSAATISAFARTLSRETYLILYVLAAAKEIQFFVRVYLSAGSSQTTMADAMKSLQAYVAYGFMALAAIWSLAALCRHLLITRDRSVRYA
jgi:cytochrome b561